MCTTTTARSSPTRLAKAKTSSATRPSGATKSKKRKSRTSAKRGRRGGRGEVTAVEEGEDLALVALHEPSLRLLLPAGAAELHAVLLGETLDLAVAEHRQAGQRHQQCRRAEVAGVVAEPVDRGALVGGAEEVHEALEHLGVERER